MRKIGKRYFYSYIFYIITAIGMSLSIKGAIGVSSISSVSLAISDVTNIKVGTITILVNLIFLLGYAYLSSFKYILKYIIQFLTVLFFGVLINFFVYDILVYIHLDLYIYRLFFLVFGTIIGGLSVGVIISLDAITYPIESFCHELSIQAKKSFLYIRYGVDLVSIVISLILTFAFELPLYVREGTLISLILLTFAMNYAKDITNRLIHKKD